MNRREAISTVTFLLGGTIIGAEAFLSGCKPEKKDASTGLTDEDVAFLDEVGEVILPTTSSSPGAKEAKVGAFMKVMVTDCYSDAEQQTFTQGISTLRKLAQEKFDDDFTALTAGQRYELLAGLAREASAYDKTKDKGVPVHYFTMIRQLTVLGYITSEPGATKAMRHVAIPGRYDAVIPYKKGDKAWS